MAKRKVQDQTEELDSYLQYEFYHDAYDELTDKESSDFGLFEPLIFYRMFSHAAEITEQNKTRPLAISQYLKDLTLADGETSLTDEQRYYFYEKLLDWFDNVRYEDEHLKICCREIEKLQKALDVTTNAVIQQPVNERQFDFEGKVKPHLEGLREGKAKLAYLYKILAEHKQSDKPLLSEGWGKPSFAEKCEAEIHKQERLLALEHDEILGGSNDMKEKRGGGGSQYQCLLAVHYLLLCARAKGHNTQKARFASFLTGYSENTFRQQWSNIHRKAEESGQVWEREMQAVRGYFEALGMHAVTKLIDEDLNFEREKL